MNFLINLFSSFTKLSDNKGKKDYKKHIDCAWLKKKPKGGYICRDLAGAKFSKEMDLKEASEKACNCFHYKGR